MSPRTTGITLIGYALLATALQWLHLQVPVLKIPFLAGPVAGYILSALLLATGVWLLISKGSEWNLSPLTRKKLQRFRGITRGYVSFLLLAAFAFVAALDNALVGKRALAVSYQGHLYFPFIHEVIPGKTFGQGTEGEADYRTLQTQCAAAGKGDWVVMPLVPYAAALDSPAVIETMETRAGDGKVYAPESNRPFSGTAYSGFASKPEQKRQEWQYRNGLRHGNMRGWNVDNTQVEKGRYENGERKEYTDFSEGKAAALESKAAPWLKRYVYPPSAPSWKHQHFLGTNTNGIDVFAMLFGGWQQALIAAILYIVVVFTLGVLIGGALGYFGGWVDLIGYRLIEIWSALPFLLVVMIISSLISPTLVILVGIFAAFGWIGTTSYLRTATYKESARDYVSAAKLLGTSTPRVILHHVLPNVIAILVTLAPFEISGVIVSLSALDFLGFGLPPDQPSWGRLLHEGVDNFTYPWMVSSAFTAMAFVLVLITFVGEAVREAFDPKKFTTYQ
ncbi:MAG: binding-protein-dependent transport system inner rane component [Verrucomicrobiaceae bacterium]|nr:binding-protein-dependent transport system inner rane component [Verrucomicrobiaceae bacterium]